MRARPETRQGPQLRSVRPRLIDSSRARLRFSLIIVLAAAGMLGYVIFPPHHLSINADGRDIALVSRQQRLGLLLNASGVKGQAGDVLVRSGNDLAVERAVPVIVHADGRTLSWRTRATTVQGLLD